LRISISNIAWDVANDEAICELLRDKGIDAIDVAPGKYFSDPMETEDFEARRIKNWWAERGIEIIGMQALLFGTVGLNMFGSPDVQAAMLAHLAAVCRIGSQLGANRLVFGSPKNRDRAGLSDDDALDAAFTFFSKLGDIAVSNGVIVCLEPNPPRYGANFMMTSVETSHVVKQVAHKGIRMQLDTGALMLNGEDAIAVIKSECQLIGHVHASEPELVPLGQGGVDHGSVGVALAQFLPQSIVTIETLETSGEPNEAAMAKSIDIAISNYHSNTDEALQ
jgi:D-psicose/D-tagatose/L-ribulose 3-epimerase